MRTFLKWGLLLAGTLAAVLVIGPPHHATPAPSDLMGVLHHMPILMGSLVGAGVLNIVDVVKGLNPDGSVAAVAEILNRVDEVMYDIPWKEGNLPTGDQITIRTGLPAPVFRRMNQGVAPTKSRKDQVVEACAELMDFSTIDVEVAKIGGDPGAARLSEAKAHIEGMNQTFMNTLWYGSSVTPEAFVGLAPRYGSLEAGNSQNIINAGGISTDNTSIWLIGWSPETIYGVYPKGMMGGLQHKDLGEQLITVTAGQPGSIILDFVDQYIWNCGLAVKDWRYAVRIANIDVSNLTGETTPADLSDLLIRAVSRFPSSDKVNTGIYMNRTVYEMLAIQRRQDVRAGGQLKMELVDGKFIPFFMGIPIRKSDSILLTESLVS